MFSVFLIFVFVFALTALFVSRRLSPIPYFPSNKKDIKGIVSALQLSNDQIVYDLGAGDGVVIFYAASAALDKKLKTKFVAVEINPVLLIVMTLRRLFNPNRKNIQILRADIFAMRYAKHKSQHTFFAYISPWYLEKVFRNCKSQVKKFEFISYFYPIPKLKSSRTIKGVHNTYIYNV